VGDLRLSCIQLVHELVPIDSHEQRLANPDVSKQRVVVWWEEQPAKEDGHEGYGSLTPLCPFVLSNQPFLEPQPESSGAMDDPREQHGKHAAELPAVWCTIVPIFGVPRK